jgi:hypothetical protein
MVVSRDTTKYHYYNELKIGMQFERKRYEKSNKVQFVYFTVGMTYQN